MKDIIRKELSEAQSVLENFFIDDNLNKIESAANIFKTTISQGNKIISCGNGGSMCDAMHFAEELTGKFRDERKSLPAIAISDPSHITCVGNDYGFANIFSKYIEGVGKEGDAILAISTSGNSTNILNAAKEAQKKGMHIVALTGKNKSLLSDLATLTIATPSESKWSDRVQELHIKCIHILIEIVESIISKKTSKAPIYQTQQVDY